MTDNETFRRKPMSLGAYIGLCFVAWIVGAFVANGISITMSNAYAEATGLTIIGFWLAKFVLKNKRRDWVGIVAFPIITFTAAILGHSLGFALAARNPGGSALIGLVVAFALSFGLFALLNRKKSH